MSATTPRRFLDAPITAGAVCWDCSHAPDEHIGANGSCIAYVIAVGRETFCQCRCFVPDDGDAA